MHRGCHTSPVLATKNVSSIAQCPLGTQWPILADRSECPASAELTPFPTALGVLSFLLQPSDACLPTHTCTRTHTNAHTYTEMHANACTRTHTCTCAPTHTHTETHVHMHAHTYAETHVHARTRVHNARVCTHAHRDTCMHSTCTPTHAHTYTETHARVHTHTHMFFNSISKCPRIKVLSYRLPSPTVHFLNLVPSCRRGHLIL